MYGIPTTFPISQIVGESVDQLCIGRHDLVINLSNNRRFLIEGPIQTSEMSEPSYKYNEFAQTLAKLIGDKAVECNVTSQFIEIIFFNSSIRIIDDCEHYESFVFEFEGGRVVV